MTNNKSFLIPGAILLGFVLLIAATIWATGFFSFKIGVIDYTRISSNENRLFQRLNDSVQSKGLELQSKFNSAKTDAMKNQISKEFETYKADKQKELNSKIQTIVSKIAKQKGLKAVANSQAFIYGEIDLTNDVLQECNR